MLTIPSGESAHNAHRFAGTRRAGRDEVRFGKDDAGTVTADYPVARQGDETDSYHEGQAPLGGGKNGNTSLKERFRAAKDVVGVSVPDFVQALEGDPDAIERHGRPPSNVEQLPGNPTGKTIVLPKSHGEPPPVDTTDFKALVEEAQRDSRSPGSGADCLVVTTFSVPPSELSPPKTENPPAPNGKTALISASDSGEEPTSNLYVEPDPDQPVRLQMEKVIQHFSDTTTVAGDPEKTHFYRSPVLLRDKHLTSVDDHFLKQRVGRDRLVARFFLGEIPYEVPHEGYSQMQKTPGEVHTRIFLMQPHEVQQEIAETYRQLSDTARNHLPPLLRDVLDYKLQNNETHVTDFKAATAASNWQANRQWRDPETQLRRARRGVIAAVGTAMAAFATAVSGLLGFGSPATPKHQEDPPALLKQEEPPPRETADLPFFKELQKPNFQRIYCTVPSLKPEDHTEHAYSTTLSLVENKGVQYTPSPFITRGKPLIPETTDKVTVPYLTESTVGIYQKGRLELSLPKGGPVKIERLTRDAAIGVKFPPIGTGLNTIIVPNYPQPHHFPVNTTVRPLGGNKQDIEALLLEDPNTEVRGPLENKDPETVREFPHLFQVVPVGGHKDQVLSILTANPKLPSFQTHALLEQTFEKGSLEERAKLLWEALLMNKPLRGFPN